MTRTLAISLLTLICAAGPAAAAAAEAEPAPAPIQSMSALAFGPGGVLFIGDSKGGAVYAVELPERQPTEWAEWFTLSDVEGKIAALLGTTADEVMIHDLAADPRTRHVYLAVSRGRGSWGSNWMLPNEAADATLLLVIDGSGAISELVLEPAAMRRVALPNPVDAAKKHPWKDTSLRAETITDMGYDGGVLYVAGLSNEEFASTLWKVPYPFGPGVGATTLEIYHGAHGAFETHAPIRTFVPYRLRGEPHLLAAYLCTPFVTFRTSELADGEHVRGRTLGEFGAGNYPLDMVVYRKDGKDRLLIANSNLPLMIVKPEDIESFEGEILEKPDTYLAGLAYEPRSGTGILQLDALGADSVVALKRMPNGGLNLLTVPVGWF